MNVRPPFLLLFLCAALAWTACEKLDLPNGTPDCVKSKIRTYHQDHGDGSPTDVYKYEADGKDYYLFVPDCCDQFIELYDDHCNYVCAPSGGFSGRGDGNCPVWSSTPVTTLIWKRK